MEEVNRLGTESATLLGIGVNYADEFEAVRAMVEECFRAEGTICGEVQE